VNTVDIDFPLHIGPAGRTATALPDDHVRQMIELVLFTDPGERVNRPDFGTGLRGLVFGPNSPELAAALKVSIQVALQRWLGDLISVDELSVTSEDATLLVTVGYTVTATGQHQTVTLTQGGAQ
jgi:phage baseplate assembly protein W